jgi:mannitol-1-phosphate 5-dehydrogenase
MVPIMKPEDLAQDPLWIFAEEYNTLIVDRAAFRSAIPEVPGIKPVDNIRAYVDRKLFIHNLGHASCAYLGYSYSHELTTIAEAITIPEVRTGTRDAMLQSAEALLLEYPQTFSRKELVEHVEDLLTRFANRQLGDTIYRVGRDLYRKLGREDRLVGAMLLAQRHSCDYDAISRAFAAALQFAALSSDGELFPGDREFRELELPRGVASILTRVSKLDPALPEDRMVFRTVKATAEGGKSE